MASRKKRRQLADRNPERWVVVGRSGGKRVYTDFDDALAVAKRCSRNRAGKPCKLMHGFVGSEKVVAVCLANRCRKA